MELAELLNRVPEGWSAVVYDGRRYGLTRVTRAGGRSVSVYAEELGGPDVVSTNAYRTTSGDLLRPCEMPAAKVLAFLGGWATRTAGSVPGDSVPEPDEYRRGVVDTRAWGCAEAAKVRVALVLA